MNRATAELTCTAGLAPRFTSTSRPSPLIVRPRLVKKRASGGLFLVCSNERVQYLLFAHFLLQMSVAVAAIARSMTPGTITTISKLRHLTNARPK